MTCSMKIFDRSLSSERSLLYMRGRDFDGGDPDMAERKYIISILDKIVHFDNIGTIKNHRTRASMTGTPCGLYNFTTSVTN